MNAVVSDRAPKILFIILDSADPDRIRGWAEEGALPTFRSLLERARWGAVENAPGVYVGAIWTSFYTARSPASHGRYWFHQIRSGTYDILRSGSRDVRIEPFWDTLGRAGRRVAVIDVPETRVSQDLNGIHLVDWGTHAPEPDGFRAWPPTLAREVGARFGEDPVGLCDRRVLEPNGFASLRDALLERVPRKEAISRHFLGQEPWDLFLTEFADSHCAGHQFWHYQDARHPWHAEAEPSLGNPMRDVYVALDAAVGRLLAQVGPRTHAFVLCSHGMGPCAGANFLLDEVLCRLEGAPSPVRRRRPLDALLWCWQRLPWSVRSRLRSIRDPLVRRIDETRPSPDAARKCFQVPHNDAYGALRINLRGREPAGRIARGAEYDELCDSLTRDLTALRNVDTGGPVVNRVLRMTDLHDGPNVDALPDLLVEWNRDAPIRGVTSEKTGLVSGTDHQHRSGDHKPDGLFFATGPGFGSGPLTEKVSILDFAPTIASLLSVPLPGAEGNPIRELLEPLAARASNQTS